MVPDSFLHNLVDLHIHLGSASTPHFLWELAHDQGIRLAEKDYQKFIDSVIIRNKTDYQGYLNYFHLTELIQSSPYGVEKATHNAISNAYRKSDVSTIEIRFCPMFRNKGGEQDLDKIIFSALVGMKKAMIEYPVRAGLILMMDRRLDTKLNAIIAEKASLFRNEGVVGLDIAGPIETPLNVDGLIQPVEQAKAAGLKITIHTGEVTSVEEMWEVVNKLKPDRIGHGIQAVKDQRLLDHIREHSIVLELCPTSNLSTKAVKSWQEMKHIITVLKQNSILFTINSDGPELLQTNVKQELLKLYKHNILSLEEIQKTIETAKKYSFITNSQKELYENISP
ncbi:adenosine deaminase [Candidatus Roizmanbacteria bacterium]|nr:adenosine deaminase [Candidatus Roizmanbacteria bacterium]